MPVPFRFKEEAGFFFSQALAAWVKTQKRREKQGLGCVSRAPLGVWG